MTSKDQFRRVLDGIASSGVRDLKVLDAAFVEAVLSYGSRTVDNENCVERVGVGPTGEDANRVGLVMRSSGRALGDIVNAAEGSPVPQLVIDEFSDVTQADWDAVLRIATLILTALESEA